MKSTQKPAIETSGHDPQSPALSAEELAALKETVRERKGAARRVNAADGARDVLAKIAEMPEPDRVLAERIHALVTTNAPSLSPRTWYGMPAYANADGKIVCFFQAAAKFKSRYATLGFSDHANLDEGTIWPTSWALTRLTDADEAAIIALVERAVS